MEIRLWGHYTSCVWSGLTADWGRLHSFNHLMRHNTNGLLLLVDGKAAVTEDQFTKEFWGGSNVFAPFYPTPLVELEAPLV